MLQEALGWVSGSGGGPQAWTPKAIESAREGDQFQTMLLSKHVQFPPRPVWYTRLRCAPVELLWPVDSEALTYKIVINAGINAEHVSLTEDCHLDFPSQCYFEGGLDVEWIVYSIRKDDEVPWSGGCFQSLDSGSRMGLYELDKLSIDPSISGQLEFADRCIALEMFDEAYPVLRHLIHRLGHHRDALTVRRMLAMMFKRIFDRIEELRLPSWLSAAAGNENRRQAQLVYCAGLRRSNWCKLDEGYSCPQCAVAG